MSQGGGPPKREAFKALRGVTGLNRARPAPRPGDECLAVGKTSAAESRFHFNLTSSCNIFDNSWNKFRRLESPTLLPLSRRSLVLQGIAHTNRLHLQPTKPPMFLPDLSSPSLIQNLDARVRLVFSMHRTPGRPRLVHVSSSMGSPGLITDRRDTSFPIPTILMPSAGSKQ